MSKRNSLEIRVEFEGGDLYEKVLKDVKERFERKYEGVHLAITPEAECRRWSVSVKTGVGPIEALLLTLCPSWNEPKFYIECMGVRDCFVCSEDAVYMAINMAVQLSKAWESSMAQFDF